jgi:hypothetical protein
MLLCRFGAEDKGPISTSGAQYAKLEDARPKHWWIRLGPVPTSTTSSSALIGGARFIASTA